MTPRARRVAALGIVLAALAALRWLVPDPAARREWTLLVAIPLGYGHVLGALWFGRGRARRLGGFCLGVGVVCLVLLAGAGVVPTALFFAALAVWHVLENEIAPGDAGRLPCFSRSPRAHPAPLLGSAALVGTAVATPWLTRPALQLGLPVALAAWTAEEVFVAVLSYHVVAWALRAARRDRFAAVAAVHAVPLILAVACAVAWPAAHAAATAPLPYLLTSVAHALHTSWERGLAPRG